MLLGEGFDRLHELVEPSLLAAYEEHLSREDLGRGVVVTWIGDTVAHQDVASELFWEALIFGLVVLCPRALTLGVALRDLRRWRAARGACCGELIGRRDVLRVRKDRAQRWRMSVRHAWLVR